MKVVVCILSVFCCGIVNGADTWGELLLSLPKTVPAFSGHWTAIRTYYPNAPLANSLKQMHLNEVNQGGGTETNKKEYALAQKVERDTIANGFTVPLDVKLDYLNQNKFYIHRKYDGRVITEFFSKGSGAAFRVERVNKTVHIFSENNSFLEQLGRGIPILGLKKYVGEVPALLLSEKEDSLMFLVKGGRVVSLVTVDKADLMLAELSCGYAKDFDEKNKTLNSVLFEISVKGKRKFEGFSIPETVTYKLFHSDGKPKQKEVWKLEKLSKIDINEALKKIDYTFEKGYLITDFSSGIPREFYSDEVILKKNE